MHICCLSLLEMTILICMETGKTSVFFPCFILNHFGFTSSIQWFFETTALYSWHILLPSMPLIYLSQRSLKYFCLDSNPRSPFSPLSLSLCLHHGCTSLWPYICSWLKIYANCWSLGGVRLIYHGLVFMILHMCQQSYLRFLQCSWIWSRVLVARAFMCKSLSTHRFANVSWMRPSVLCVWLCGFFPLWGSWRA